MARRRNLLLGGKHFNTLAAEDGWLLDLRMDGSSSLTNYGTASLTVTPTDLTFGVGGLSKLGGTAVDFAASTSVITVTNNAAINALTAFTYLGVMDADTAGAVTGGRWFHWIGVADENIVSFKTTGFFECRVERVTTDATFNTDTGVVSYPTGALMLALTYTEAAGILLYKTVGRSLMQVTGGTNAIGSGATSGLASGLRIGNTATASRAFDGRMYRFMLRSGALEAGRLQEYAGAAL